MIHQRKSPRWKDYDYSSPWWYFVTICTKGREHYFGEIYKGEMKLSEIGTICKQEIKDTEQRRSHIRIDEYIIMPNHIHLLMIVGENPVGTYGNTSNDHTSYNITNNDALPRVPTQSLWSIIRNIKSRVTKYTNQNNLVFARQSRYHDHIIRNEDEYNRIKYYIQTNPENQEFE